MVLAAAASIASGKEGAAEISARQHVVLKAERLLDVAKGRILSPGVVVISGNTITAINPSAVPDRASIVELGDTTLVPGLIDVHAHFNGYLEMSHEEVMHLSPIQRALRATVEARQMLLDGFTTVRVLGSRDFVEIAIGEAADKGFVEAPRIVGSGYQVHPYMTEEGLDSVKLGSANGVVEVAQAVRYMVENGARWIKIRATPLGATPIPRTDISSYTVPELQAIVAEAERLRVKVAAHAHGPTGLHNAVLAGVHSIEHGSLVTKETLREMAKRGTYLVPTLGVVPSFMEPGGSPGGSYESMSPEIKAAEDHLLATQLEMLPIARELGVKIAFGTDLPPPGNVIREIEMLLKVGFTPIEVIRAATVHAADLLGFDDRGQIATGKLADIVAVHGNPLTDARALAKVCFVMKDGEIHRQCPT